MPLTIAATTESDSSDLTLDETITGNYSLGNVNSLTGELTNGLFFSTSGNNQIINLEAVTTTSDKYMRSFGFTEKEVFTALEDAGLGEQKEKVKIFHSPLQ